MNEVRPTGLRDIGGRSRLTWSSLETVALTSVVVWSAVMMAVAVLRGVRHDYVAYVGQWALVRDGVDPWSTDNTYGPIHNLLAFLTDPTPLGPKILMGVAFITANFLLLVMLLEARPDAKALLAYVVIVPLNFLVIGVVFSYGLNDSLVAALVGFAVLARFRDKAVLVGILLGLAVLVKFYPALLIPFFCLDNRRFDPRPLLAALATAALGFLAAWAVWGAGFVGSMTTGVSREPKLLSVLSSLERNQVFGAGSSVVTELIATNAIFVAVAVVLAYWASFKMRLSWIEGSAIAGLVVLLTYKVGHQQFYIFWLFLLVGLLILGTPRARFLAFCCLPYVVFLSLFQFGYEVLTDGYRSVGGVVRDDAGFAAFALGAATLVVFFVGSRRLSGPNE